MNHAGNLSRRKILKSSVIVGGLAGTALLAQTQTGGSKEASASIYSVKHATAAFSKDAMHAAHAVNGPTYAPAITTTSALLEALP
jgi:hypothetical protein